MKIKKWFFLSLTAAVFLGGLWGVATQMSKEATLAIDSSKNYLNRDIASITNENDLEYILNSLARSVDNPVDSAKECYVGLSNYYNKLLEITSDTINMDNLKGDALTQMIEQSFTTRLIIKQKMKPLEVVSEDTKKCLAAIRDTVRALRYVEDYLTEMKLSADGVDLDKSKFSAFTGERPYFLVAPKYYESFKDHKDLKSGDVIISRGNAYSSAAIARIGKSDAQFSHISLVFKDVDGEFGDVNNLYTIEGHIEIGNIVAPFSAHIAQGNAREVLYRFNDASVAHKAAKYMYKKVKKYQDKGKNIKYDFAMDYLDNSKLFCSEVVYDGFMAVSKGKIDIPKFKTKFDSGLITFLNDLGIAASKENIDTFDTFAPGDLEFDPRFDLVAEWRNPAKIADSRVKDAVLTKIFDWMENRDYNFYPRAGIQVSSRAAWVMRRIPWVKNVTGVSSKFPLNMNSGQLRLFLALDEVGIELYKKIEVAQKLKKHPLTPIEMYKALDDFREADLKKYVISRFKVQHNQKDGLNGVTSPRRLRTSKGERALFHKQFHGPRKEINKLIREIKLEDVRP